MPATALRHPETEEPVAFTSHSADTPSLEWRSVAPYVDRFTGAAPATERAAPRRRSRRHKPFVLSGPFLAGTLVFVELTGLVWIYALQLKTLRQEDALRRQGQDISLQIALNQNKLASYKSSPLLTQWATQLGYRPLRPDDSDDVTSDAPLPAPVAEEKGQP